MFEEHGQNFEEQLGWYLTHGVVVCTPDRFIMAKPIRSWIGYNDWDAPDADCWYVHCAVGKGCLEWYLLQAPYRLPKLAWKRIGDPDNRLKCYNTATFERFA